MKLPCDYDTGVCACDPSAKGCRAPGKNNKGEVSPGVHDNEADHTDLHIDSRGLCWCDCDLCSRYSDTPVKPGSRVVCICPDCNPVRCGIHDQPEEGGT